MRWVLITCVIMVMSVFMVNQAQGGTLDRGVHISSFFAGWTNGNSAIAQLKYQMAIDSYLGITKRYTTITNTYVNYEGGSTFNDYDIDVSNSDDSEANVEINNNTNIFDVDVSNSGDSEATVTINNDTFPD